LAGCILAPDYLGIQDLLEAPWAVALTDFAYPQTRSERPPDLEKRFHYGAPRGRGFGDAPDRHEVRHLIRPQSALREPKLAWRVTALMTAVA
jgi:hypothetical protein